MVTTKKLILSILAIQLLCWVPGQSFSDDQKKAYVCPPCGCNQHDHLFEAAGKCPDCNMKLVIQGVPENYNPRLSPDGRQLAFVSTRDDDVEIYAATIGKDQIRRLTQSTGDDEHISWSPDGKKIAFTSFRNGRNNADIFVMNADGSHQTQLTHDTEMDMMPAWSPDGTQLAFVSNRGERNYEVYTMSKDGSGQKILTDDDLYGSKIRVAWTKVGKLRFLLMASGDRQSFVMNADGSNMEETPYLATDTAYSPDEKHIAFVRRTESDRQIFIKKSASLEEKQLTFDAGADNSSPTWSANGKQIFFTSDRDGHREIYVMEIDGSEQTRLTTKRLFTQ